MIRVQADGQTEQMLTRRSDMSKVWNANEIESTILDTTNSASGEGLNKAIFR